RMCICIYFKVLLLKKSEMVLAFAGGVVLLPCNFSIPASADVPTVEWSKQGLHPYVVFLYRGGYEINEEKHPAFWYRTSLIAKEQKNGNFSLRIANVRPSDAGKYRCKRLWSDGPRDVTAVELDVVRVHSTTEKHTVVIVINYIRLMLFEDNPGCLEI
uniref:Ig-like domain-containing protein n=1 Tax=Sander lucioperca TaxID=283035 RepID=A0A8C9ZE99_SANLU